MRYGILSDIHGNLEALTEVLDACRNEGVRSYFCVGDIVGYGANPVECLELVQKMNTVCVAGNHDWAVSGKIDPVYFNPAGRAAVLWTRERISFEQSSYLHNLALVVNNEDFILVHGTLNYPESFQYLMDSDMAPDTFYLMGRNVCFIGHTHIPKIYVQKGPHISMLKETGIRLQRGDKYIFNTGSVGQPRDGNPMAAYCIYDPDLQRVEIKRVRYDIASAQKKILEAGLPEFLAHRLAIGQ